MKISNSLFQSRVARRLFVLFLFSSLVPIVTLGYLSYTDVSQKLLDQSRHHLHQVSKSIGYTLIEKLDNLHHELAVIAMRYKEHTTAKNKSSEHFKLDRKATNYFSAIAINSRNKRYIPLYNGIDEFPHLTNNQLRQLQNGNPVLTISEYSTFQKKLLMIVSLDVTAKVPNLMIAEINQKYLWNIESIIHSPAFACITTEFYETLYCSTSNIKTGALKTALMENSDSSAIFSWTENNTDFIAYHWTIFLEGKFSAAPWLVVLSKPQLETQASIDSIKSIYPVVVVLSVLVVLLLTTNQLRRNLTPLQLLQKATKQLATGDFTTRVAVNSKDEFEELSNTFNDMANRLDKQFKSLSTMAEIDRIILSSSNKDYVVDTVLRRIKDVVPCDYVLLSIIERENISHNSKNSNKLSDSIFKNSIHIEDGDSKLLLAHPKYLTIKSTQHAPKYTREITKKGVRCLVVYPIIISDILHSVITLGFKDTQKPYTDDLDHGREMADRIAVALSNASKEEKIYEQANFDSLTKLPNRTLLTDRLDQAVQRARRDGNQIVTLLVDLDRFKNINDSLGHTAGDQLLIEVATRLSSVINETDTLGRLSGDEFVVILSDVGYSKNSTSMITATAESILNAIKYPFVIQNHEVTVSASIGISMYPADTTHTEDLLRYAEIAMYHAKSQGKGAYQFYSKDINASSVAQLVLENNLRQAIRNDELELHYQPQIDRETGKIVAAEALLRWHHPELGDLAPADMLPIADSSGLIVPIGDWVLRRACAQIRTWLDQGLGAPRIAINLSAHQFREQNLIKRVRQILKEYELDINCLELEITEDTIMTDIDKTTVTLRTLNEMGIRLAVDDFGTGYSSLNYLAKFPIQYLKIDQSFIRDVTCDPNMASIVAAIIALAHSLRLQVIAEGIETQDQYDYLDQLECDLFQGHLISVPLPPEQFIEMLTKHNNDNQNRQSS